MSYTAVLDRVDTGASTWRPTEPFNQKARKKYAKAIRGELIGMCADSFNQEVFDAIVDVQLALNDRENKGGISERMHKLIGKPRNPSDDAPETRVTYDQAREMDAKEKVWKHLKIAQGEDEITAKKDARSRVAREYGLRAGRSPIARAVEDDRRHRGDDVLDFQKRSPERGYEVTQPPRDVFTSLRGYGH